MLGDGVVEGGRGVVFGRELRFVFRRNFPVRNSHAVGETREAGAVGEKAERMLHAAPAQRVGNRHSDYLMSRAGCPGSVIDDSHGRLRRPHPSAGAVEIEKTWRT